MMRDMTGHGKSPESIAESGQNKTAAFTAHN